MVSGWLQEALVNRAGPELPLSEQELAVKFIDTAKRALSTDAVDLLRTHIVDIESAANVHHIAAILGSAAG